MCRSIPQLIHWFINWSPHKHVQFLLWLSVHENRHFPTARFDLDFSLLFTRTSKDFRIFLRRGIVKFGEARAEKLGHMGYVTFRWDIGRPTTFVAPGGLISRVVYHRIKVKTSGTAVSTGRSIWGAANIDGIEFLHGRQYSILNQLICPPVDFTLPKQTSLMINVLVRGKFLVRKKFTVPRFNCNYWASWVFNQNQQSDMKMKTRNIASLWWHTVECFN